MQQDCRALTKYNWQNCLWHYLALSISSCFCWLHVALSYNLILGMPADASGQPCFCWNQIQYLFTNVNYFLISWMSFFYAPAYCDFMGPCDCQFSQEQQWFNGFSTNTVLASLNLILYISVRLTTSKADCQVFPVHKKRNPVC